MFNTAAALRLFQRDSARLPAMSSTDGGLQLPAGRGDEDDGWRVALVDELNRQHGIHGKAWPCLSARPMRVEASQRFGIREGV